MDQNEVQIGRGCDHDRRKSWLIASGVERGTHMAGWFEPTTNAAGQFHFVLKAGNAATILTSQQYTTKGAAATGIASVQTNSPLDERYDRKVASNGQQYFNLLAANGHVIGTSQRYHSAATRDKGIASVRTNGPTATINDATTDTA